MPYSAGWEGDVKIGTDVATMRSATPIDITDIEAEVKNNLEEIFKMGQRKPDEIKDGLMNIASKIMGYWQDNTLPGYAVSDTALTEYVIGFYPRGYTSTYLGFYVTGKFDGVKITGGVGKLTEFDMPFKADDFQFDTVP